MTGLPLDGTRVLEIGGGIPAAFATRWLAGFGADVIRTEGPAGKLTPDEETYLLPGKRRVAVERDSLRKLALAADILVEDSKPGTLAELGIAPDDLRRENPALVIVSLTPFGQTGPYAGYESTNAVSFAMGGIMSLTGDPSLPPLVSGGSQAQYLGGLNGFSAALTAYFGAIVQGEGDWIDISFQECAAGMLEASATRTDYAKTGPAMRSGNQLMPTWGIYQLADGYGGVCALARQIPALFRVIGDPELLEPKFMDSTERVLHTDELLAKLFAWFGERTKAELLELGPANKIPFGAVMTPADLLENQTLAERGFFDTVQMLDGGEARIPGRPFLGFEWRPGELHAAAADTEAVVESWLGVPV